MCGGVTPVGSGVLIRSAWGLGSSLLHHLPGPGASFRPLPLSLPQKNHHPDPANLLRNPSHPSLNWDLLVQLATLANAGKISIRSSLQDAGFGGLGGQGRERLVRGGGLLTWEWGEGPKEVIIAQFQGGW